MTVLSVARVLVLALAGQHAAAAALRARHDHTKIGYFLVSEEVARRLDDTHVLIGSNERPENVGYLGHGYYLTDKAKNLDPKQGEYFCEAESEEDHWRENTQKVWIPASHSTSDASADAYVESQKGDVAKTARFGVYGAENWMVLPAGLLTDDEDTKGSLKVRVDCHLSRSPKFFDYSVDWRSHKIGGWLGPKEPAAPAADPATAPARAI